MIEPAAAQIRDDRIAIGLTQTQAGAVIGYSLRGWQDIEAGKRRLHPLLWVAWRIRAGLDRPESILNV